jgi:hypothetical protein
MNCPRCDTQFQDRAIYCQACGTQARCKQCRHEPSRDARVCISCGAPTTVGDADRSSQVPTVNRIRFVETEKRRSLDAELTDDAVGLIGQSLRIFVTGQLQARSGGRTRLHGNEPLIIDQQPSLPANDASTTPEVRSSNGAPDNLWRIIAGAAAPATMRA